MKKSINIGNIAIYKTLRCFDLKYIVISKIKDNLVPEMFLDSYFLVYNIETNFTETKFISQERYFSSTHEFKNIPRYTWYIIDE